MPARLESTCWLLALMPKSPVTQFLEKMGAERTGHLKEVVYKFGHYVEFNLRIVPLGPGLVAQP